MFDMIFSYFRNRNHSLTPKDNHIAEPEHSKKMGDFVLGWNVLNACNEWGLCQLQCLPEGWPPEMNCFMIITGPAHWNSIPYLWWTILMELQKKKTWQSFGHAVLFLLWYNNTLFTQSNSSEWWRSCCSWSRSLSINLAAIVHTYPNQNGFFMVFLIVK